MRSRLVILGTPLVTTLLTVALAADATTAASCRPAPRAKCSGSFGTFVTP